MFRWSLCSFCLFHTLQVKCCTFSFLFNFILLISDHSSNLPRSFKHHIVLHVVQVNLTYECIHIRLYVFSLPTSATLFWVRPQSKSNCFILNNRGHGQGSHKTSVSTCKEVTGSTVLTINESIWWNNYFFSFFTELTGKPPTHADLEGKNKGKSLGKKTPLSQNRKTPQKRNIQSKGSSWFNEVSSSMI